MGSFHLIGGKTMLTVGQILHDKAELFEKKGEEYGHTYKQFGMILGALFPRGITLNTTSQFNRFALISMVMHKMARDCHQFETGGHVDSCDDLVVYSAMLRELTHPEKRKSDFAPLPDLDNLRKLNDNK